MSNTEAYHLRHNLYTYADRAFVYGEIQLSAALRLAAKSFNGPPIQPDLPQKIVEAARKVNRANTEEAGKTYQRLALQLLADTQQRMAEM